MERLDRRPLLPEDQGRPLQDHIDTVVEAEKVHDPKRVSRRGQLIEILETFGYEVRPLEVAQFLGITEQEMTRFSSRRGIRYHEFEVIEERFNDTLAIARIARDRHPNGPFAFVDRRAMLSEQQPQFADEETGKARSALDLMRVGEGYKVVSVLGNSENFQLDYHFNE